MNSRWLRSSLTAGVLLTLTAALVIACGGTPDGEDLRADKAGIVPTDHERATEGAAGLVGDDHRSMSNDQLAVGLPPTAPESGSSDGLPMPNLAQPGGGAMVEAPGQATEPGSPPPGGGNPSVPASQMGPMGRLQKAVEFKGPVEGARVELGAPVLTAELHGASIAFTVDDVSASIDRTVVELDGVGLWMSETPHDGGYVETFIVPAPAGETVRWRAASAVAPGMDGNGYAFGPWSDWSVLEGPPRPPSGGVTRSEVITVHPDSRWGELMVSFSDAERQCIRDRVGDDFERVMTLPALPGGDAQQHEVDVFGCLSGPTAGRLFVAMMKAGSQQPLGAVAEHCLTELLARTDLAAVYRHQMEQDDDGDGTLVAGFSAEVMGCLADGAGGDAGPEPGPANRGSG